MDLGGVGGVILGAAAVVAVTAAVIASGGALLVPVIAGAAIGAGVNVGVSTAITLAEGGSVTWEQVGAAAASGAIAGAVGTIAGPLGGTIARGLGESSAGLAAKGINAGIASIGAAAGQEAANAIDPCTAASVANAALFGAAGQFIEAFIPVQGVYTLSQSSYFAPSTIAGLYSSANARNLLASYLIGSGIAAGSNF